MREIISRILIGIAVSCFFYPFGFKFLPGINTKMILGVLGAIIFAFRFKTREHGEVRISVIVLTFLTLLFSFLCYFSAVYFNTDDLAYASYFISFFVWVFGAYAICEFIRIKNGVTDLKTISYYLIIVAVIQCILSQLISDFPAIRSIVDGTIIQGQEFLREVNRLYGIGASLDNAGVRFAITLLLTAYFISEKIRKSDNTKDIWMLVPSFIFITVFGNMIARTTTVGAILGITYILVQWVLNADVNIKFSRVKSLMIMIILFAAAIPLFIYYYSTSAEFNEQLRFAFEGFFNWVETGHFSTSSTDKLNANMWIWPDDTLTWLIGTGKFDNWAFGTDIGYCRFIMYCGLLGFLVFATFFIYNAFEFSRKFDGVKILSLFLLSITFIVWIKVSTDIFQIYAILICADAVVDARSDASQLTEQ